MVVLPLFSHEQESILCLPLEVDRIVFYFYQQALVLLFVRAPFNQVWSFLQFINNSVTIFYRRWVAHTHRGGGFCTPNAKIPRDEPARHGEFLRWVTEPPSSMCVFENHVVCRVLFNFPNSFQANFTILKAHLILNHMSCEFCYKLQHATR